MVQAQSVADLVNSHGEQIEAARADAKDLPGVELDVSSQRVVVDRRRHVGHADSGRAKVEAANANIADGGVALLITAGADGDTAVRDDAEVDIGLLCPYLGRFEDLVLPGRGRPFGVKGGEQVAGRAAKIG